MTRRQRHQKYNAAIDVSANREEARVVLIKLGDLVEQHGVMDHRGSPQGDRLLIKEKKTGKVLIRNLLGILLF